MMIKFLRLLFPLLIVLTIQACNDDSNEVDCTALETSTETKSDAWEAEVEELFELLYDFEEGTASVTCTQLKEKLKSFITKSEELQDVLKKGAKCEYLSEILEDGDYANIDEVVDEIDTVIEELEEYTNYLCD